ncbi:MAG: hypothetical protein K0B81_03450 [Candidatus Cloacimonetes bacterium]|nr:hypothetical protein [Candidatus Cloacimonadota bacterium]
MKKNLLLLCGLLTITCFLMLFVGCSSSDGDSFSLDDMIGPEGPDLADFDYFISIEYWDFIGDFTKQAVYSVYIETTNPEGFLEEINLMIDGEEVALIYNEFHEDYSANITLEQGVTYDFVLVTESKSYSATLMTPFIPSVVTFPDELDYEVDQTISWVLQEDNKYQLVSFTSIFWDEDVIDTSSYIKVIEPSDRQHTIPANSIVSLGVESNLAMSLAQIDFVANNRLLVAARAINQKDNFEDYAIEKMIKQSREELIELIKSLQ